MQKYELVEGLPMRWYTTGRRHNKCHPCLGTEGHLWEQSIAHCWLFHCSKEKKKTKLVYVSWKLNLFWVSNVISYRVHPKKSDKKSFIARKFKSALLLSIKQKSLQFWLELIFFTW